MKLMISQLKAGENPFHWISSQDPSMTELSDELKKEGFQVESPLAFSGALHNHEPDYYLEGKVNWTVKQDCSRCAEAFSSPYAADFKLALVHETRREEKEENDLDIYYFSGPELDLKSLLHEQFVLSLPLRALCSETCKGICQTCGTNLNKETCGCHSMVAPNAFSVLKTMKV